MFIKNVLFFVLCVPLCLSGMELDFYEPVSVVPREIQWEIVDMGDFLTMVQFGRTTKENYQKYNVKSCIVNNPSLCKSLTPYQHGSLLVCLAQQGDTEMMAHVMGNEHIDRWADRYQFKNAVQFYHNGVLGDTVNDYMNMYNGTILKKLKVSFENFGFNSTLTDNDYVLGVCLQNGLDLNCKKDPKGTTLLTQSCAMLSSKPVAMLVESGADVNISDVRGDTALHILATRADASQIVPILRKLLEAKPKINAQNQWGATPLHVAISNDNPYMTQELLKAGADITIKDCHERTPEDYASIETKKWLNPLLSSKGQMSEDGGITVTLVGDDKKRKRVVSADNGDQKRFKRARA